LQHEKISISVGMRSKRILAVTLLIIYLVICQLTLSTQIINHAEEQCIQRLKEATAEFSTNYYEHAMSDREQLRVVADMLAVLMEEGVHDLHVHLASFEQRGMLDWLQVLFPDGTLFTGTGTYDLTGQLDYNAEVDRLPYISNVSAGFVLPEKNVIRSAVPINVEGETIAILYGVYDLSAGHDIGRVTAYDGQSYTFILESDTGNYILDGLRGHTTTGSVHSHYEAKPGFDLSVMEADLAACREGYSAFRSLSVDEYMYIYYAPIGINNWMVMVSVPESAAMSFAYESRDLLLTTVAYISLGVIIYFILIHLLDQKLHSKNQFVSSIQSQLMEVYLKPDHYHTALQAVSDRARAAAVFLLDEQLPAISTITGKDADLVADYQRHSGELDEEILTLCRQHRKKLTLRASGKQLRASPRLTRFLRNHNQRSIVLIPLTTPEGSIHQAMGAFSPDNGDAAILLDALSPDFFIAANNIDYLTQLNIASTVDTLTDVMNRTSYHLRLEKLCSGVPEGFACVYVDVNDLHAVNNRYGHEHGDVMLRTIAKSFAEAFGRENVYRFGGDEFIILVENTTEQIVSTNIARAESAINQAGYTVSIGYEWASRTSNVDNMIRAAESRMYKAKYLFYQQKEKQKAVQSPSTQATQCLHSGHPDIDAFLQATSHYYRGVYIVNLRTDKVREIIAHDYFHNALQENDQLFSKAFRYYMAEIVDKQSRRSVQNFLDFDQINAQLAANETPIVEYTRVDGLRVRLTVHRGPGYTPENPETLWVKIAT